jgi:hypothetical protein
VRLIGLTALFTMACAGAQTDRAEVPERPFIKLAKREMALVVYWRGAPEPGYHQALERSLARRLTSAYHTEPLTRRVEGAYAALEPEYVLELVERGVDDVVLVETRRQQDRIIGRVVIRALASGAIVQKLSIPPIAGKGGSGPDPERVADFVALKITHHWTDPGSAPLLDPMAVANRLAAAKACDQALAIYRKVFATKGVVSINDMEREATALARREACEREVAMREAIEADRRATFALELDAAGVSKNLAEGLKNAVESAKLGASLAKLTDKPVYLRFRPGELLLDVRYQVERYRGKNSSRPTVIDGNPVLHLHPYVPFMEEMIRVKHRLFEAVPAFEQKTVEETTLVLHLRKVFDEYVEIGFAGEPALLISDELRVKSGRREPVIVTSVEPRVTNSRRFVLGPPAEADGSLTTYGLVWEFFELDR